MLKSYVSLECTSKKLYDLLTWRSEEQDSPGWLDSDGLEETRMSERELDHLLDLRQLLPATSDVVVSDSVERVLFLFTLDRLTLAVDDSVGCDDAKRSGICFDNLIVE